MASKADPKTTKIDIAALKADIREKLRAFDAAKVEKIAGDFGLEKKHLPPKKMNPGMRRMQISNMICGCAARVIREDGWSKNEVLALLK